ncbi:hypothetical protein LTR95_010783 [Oleoguttula sp. CCFEE 5521]
MSASTSIDERLSDELSLINTIWGPSERELEFTDGSSNFAIRLPDEYLTSALPTVIKASAEKQDLRQALSEKVREMSVGEEVLDQIFESFFALVETSKAASQLLGAKPVAAMKPGEDLRKATVIIWLHHLLNTNKRKLALSPAGSVSGMTKPGYPGVLIYSGPSDAVHEHVNELKAQNWAAFQVRLDSAEEWRFEHAKGVIEVENLGDVVKGVGVKRKDEFMEAMRMK